MSNLYAIDRRAFLAATGAMSMNVLAQASGEQPLAPPDRESPNLKIPRLVGKKIGFAIIGLGQLALEEILPAFAHSTLTHPVALVSGHPEKAQKIAAFYGIDPKNIYDYTTFDQLRDNPKIDVVYIVLPNSMHAEYTIRGFKAGKHVLCEKPMATSSGECREMIAASHQAQRKLMIAYRLHYEPFNQTVSKLCRDKAIGSLRAILATNCQVTKAPNIRLSKQLGGGLLGDVGIYCLNAARSIIREEPIEVTAFADRPSDEPRFREVPRGMTFDLRFPSGALAHCDCGFDSAESRWLRINGSEGYIELDGAFGYRRQKLGLSCPDRYESLKIDPANHFAAEMDHFAECILGNQNPLTPGEEGLADMLAIEAIQEAAATGRTVTVKKQA